MAFALIVVFFAAAAMAADDAHALLAKSRSAYLENRERARYWNWTNTTTRTIVDKDGIVLEQLPSVTVESPIRSDGKRCNAVLAWGDGQKPYLADADADARCTVEQEAPDAFREEIFLETRQVKMQSRTTSAITLRIRKDPEALKSTDPLRRCAGAMEGTVRLDPVSFFPMVLDLTVAGSECELRMGAVNHYDDAPVSSAVSSLRKGATIHREYELQRDRSGNASKDFWISVRSHSLRPLRDNARNLIFWGRRFELQKIQKDRRVSVEASTTASELAAEATLKFTEAK